MTDRSTTLLLIAGALAGYGVYRAAFVPAMLVGQPVPLLVIGFVLQAVCALAAAVGVWFRQPWAAGVVMLLTDVTLRLAEEHAVVSRER